MPAILPLFTGCFSIGWKGCCPHLRRSITPYDPGQNDPEDTLLKLDLDAMLDRYVDDRLALVGRLRRLTPDDWNRTAEHGEYSHYSVFIMFRHLALHDFFHAYRIEELLLRKDWTAEWQSFAASASAG